MPLSFYKLREQPFGVTPDPHYLYESETHREALASLLYGIETGRGFTALIAKPGMGKTSLLFRTLGKLRGKGKTVFLFQTMSTPLEFLRALLADLGVQEVQASLFELQTKLNEILHENSSRGERLVVFVDEAQNLDESVLEFLRMLSNFETPRGKLMEIILSGQPQLAGRLASPGLVQLRQRISIIGRLRALSAEETALYVEHRLRVAGYSSGSPLFTGAALRLIAERSEGIPRNINNLCFNAMSLGCALKRKTIDSDIVLNVIADLDLGPLEEAIRVGAVSKSGPLARTNPARRPKERAWIPKAVIASAFLLTLLGVTVASDSLATELAMAAQTRNVTKGLAVSPPSVAPTSTVKAPPPADATEFLNNPWNQQDGILVAPGETLNQICTEKLKTCDASELKEVIRMNPWLKDPDHLEAGRELRIPSSTVVSIGALEPAKPHSDKPLMEVATK